MLQPLACPARRPWQGDGRARCSAGNHGWPLAAVCAALRFFSCTDAPTGNRQVWGAHLSYSSGGKKALAGVRSRLYWPGTCQWSHTNRSDEVRRGLPTLGGK